MGWIMVYHSLCLTQRYIVLKQQCSSLIDLCKPPIRKPHAIRHYNTIPIPIPPTITTPNPISALAPPPCAVRTLPTSPVCVPNPTTPLSGTSTLSYMVAYCCVYREATTVFPPRGSVEVTLVHVS